MFNQSRTIFKCVFRCFNLYSELPFFLCICNTIILRFFFLFSWISKLIPLPQFIFWLSVSAKMQPKNTIKIRLIPDLAWTVRRWLTSLSISEIPVLFVLIKLNYFLSSSYLAASLLYWPVRSLINIFRVMRDRMLCHLANTVALCFLSPVV